jgi:hypothetical protein
LAFSFNWLHHRITLFSDKAAPQKYLTALYAGSAKIQDQIHTLLAQKTEYEVHEYRP